jgi:hypothetical protein
VRHSAWAVRRPPSRPRGPLASDSSSSSSIGPRYTTSSSSSSSGSRLAEHAARRPCERRRRPSRPIATAGSPTDNECSSTHARPSLAASRRPCRPPICTGGHGASGPALIQASKGPRRVRLRAGRRRFNGGTLGFGRSPRPYPACSTGAFRSTPHGRRTSCCTSSSASPRSGAFGSVPEFGPSGLGKNWQQHFAAGPLSCRSELRRVPMPSKGAKQGLHHRHLLPPSPRVPVVGRSNPSFAGAPLRTRGKR